MRECHQADGQADGRRGLTSYNEQDHVQLEVLQYPQIKINYSYIHADCRNADAQCIRTTEYGGTYCILFPPHDVRHLFQKIIKNIENVKDERQVKNEQCRTQRSQCPTEQTLSCMEQTTSGNWTDNCHAQDTTSCRKQKMSLTGRHAHERKSCAWTDNNTGQCHGPEWSMSWAKQSISWTRICMLWTQSLCHGPGQKTKVVYCFSE